MGGAPCSSRAALNGVEKGVFGLFPSGDKLLRNVALIAGFTDGFDDGGVVKFLGGIDLVAPGYPCGMIVADVLVMPLDGGDDVSFHHLHVVDVIEELEVIGIELFAKGNAPFGVIALVVRVIDAGVQKLHDEGDIVFLGDF